MGLRGNVGRWRVLALVGLLACVDIGPSRRATPALPAGRLVDVELSRAEEGWSIQASGAYRLLDDRQRLIAEGSGLPPDTRLGFAHGSVTLAGSALGPPPVELRPAVGTRLRVGPRAYRGSLVVDRTRAGRPRLLNRLGLEEYLLGVVPGEMPDRFGLEALKAQAVASRTYALEALGHARALYADERSQVYGGRAAESALSTRAVQETHGLVLTRDGALHPAWFHSTCGGRTATAASVFPRAPEGWLDWPVVCLDCRDSPVYRWTRRFSAEAVCTAMGLPRAPLQAVEVKLAEDSRRPVALTLRAGGRQATLPADRLRSRLSAGRERSEQLLSTHWPRSPRIEGGQLVVDGRGWGHGVGLCQFGAAGFAARGGGFRAILLRYYPGARITVVP